LNEITEEEHKYEDVILEIYKNDLDIKNMEDLKVLHKFAFLISDQLPKMPKEYVIRIVFDPLH